MNKFIFIILFVYYPTVILGQWFPASNGIVDSVELYSCKLVNENTAYAVGDYGYIYKTTNGAVSWFRQNINSNDGLSTVFFINENTGWIAGLNKIFKTTDGGINWFIQFNASIDFRCINFTNENTGMAVGISAGNGIYKTTDKGDNWFSLQNPLPFSDLFGVFMVDTSVAYAVGEWYNHNSPVIKTTNGGINWIVQSSGTGFSLAAVSFINRDTGLFGGSLGILKYTSNGGNNWLFIQSPSGSIWDIEHVNSNIVYTGTGLTNILKSTNGGLNWIEQPTGNDICSGFSFINENTGIAVGSRGVVYKTTNGGELGIIKIRNIIPREFKLYQNYPNPFNLSTKIRFSIPAAKKVRIIVYDASGKLLKIIVNQKLSVGIYEEELDMSGYSSGIYYSVMETDNFRESRKMILLK